jgi:HlyD family secretion protein/epimerase transport system membrane fusion protein
MSAVLQMSKAEDVFSLTPAQIHAGTWRRVGLGAGLLVLLFGAGGLWMATAPLNAAATASGIVSADSQNKTIQHLEGGIIKAILADEGSKVETGQVLVQLDDTRANASLQLVMGQLWAALALDARLAAERDGAAAIAFAPELLAKQEDAAIAKIIQTQVQIFEARRESLAGEAAILRQRIGEYREEVAGLQAQAVAIDRQIVLIAEEMKDTAGLVERGLAPKPKLLALQRAASQLDGQRGQAAAQIARSRQNIGELTLQIEQLSAERLNEVVDGLREVEVQIADLQQNRLAAEDTMSRLAIRASQPGTVVRLLFHTIGGVVAPGTPVLEFVPRDDKLIIEARLKPEDIGFVQVGMPAEVRIHAYNQRRLPIILGKVTYVSADRLAEARSADKADKAGEQAYYLTRVEVDPESLKDLPSAKLYPGMAADVVIETGERTALDYLLTPITTSLRKAFREQ